jgi:transcriptional regulator GlxA family with amidase domain
MRVAVPLFERVTALDAIGPYEVLQRVPEVEVVFVGLHAGSVRTDNGMLGLVVDAELEDLPDPEIVLVPGGVGTRALLSDERMRSWIRVAHENSVLTTSVCTGSLLLAAAGLLTGLTATTHWSAYELLRSLGADPVEQRVVPHWDRRIVTAAGVSSGIDMALAVVAHLFDDVAAQAAQLIIEYDPQPAFDAGSVAKAGDLVMARAREFGDARD